MQGEMGTRNPRRPQISQAPGSPSHPDGWATPNLIRAMDDIPPMLIPPLSASDDYIAAFEQAMKAVGHVGSEADAPAAKARSAGAFDEMVRVFKSFPEITRIGLSDEVLGHFAFAAVVHHASGVTVPPLPYVRVRSMPGIPPGAVWTVVDPTDVEAVRTAVRPGQVWVLMNEVTNRNWPRVSAVVQFQRRMLGLSFGHAGRSKGSRTSARQVLIDRIRAADQRQEPMPNAAIAAEARRTGVWPDGLADDYDAMRKRIASLRRAAREG